MGCALCGAEGENGLDRVHGLDWCATCRATDPTDALVAAGFAVEWDTRMKRFSAGMHVPGVDPEFSLACRPERWTTALAKVWVAEIEVGDPTFDDAVYVRTSDGDQARAVLGEEGVRSALPHSIRNHHEAPPRLVLVRDGCPRARRRAALPATSTVTTASSGKA